MNIASALWKALLFVVATAALFLFPRAASAAEPPKRVLIFSSEEQQAPGILALNQPIRSTLRNGLSVHFQFFYEALDSFRISTEKYEGELVRLLQRKYDVERFDLIYALGPPALNFLLKHQGELFTDTPLIYIVTDIRRVADLDPGPNVTGVGGKLELAPTLDIALALLPQTQSVVVVAGRASSDTTAVALARQEFRPYEGKVEFTYLINLPIEELKQRLAGLPGKTIVFYLSVNSDPAARIYSSPEVLAQLAPSSSAPIFGASQIYIGNGMIGGRLLSYEEIGTRAAEIGLRILAGESPQSIPPQTMPAATMFDWREVKRWGISEDRLPPGAIVKFKELSFWEQYRWRIISLISLVIVQSVLIAGLVINRVRRKRAEESLQQTQSELAHVGRVMITGELAATIAHEVNQPLTAMVANANATRRMLGNGNANLDEAREAIDDIVKDAHRASQVVGRIRALLRKDPRRLEPLAINEVIEEVVAIARNELVGKRVSLRMELADGLPKVEADRVEVQQVILNLMMNAVEAMRSVENEGRKLVIRTAKYESGGTLIAVQDSGIGITSENLERIFDAFYTTRKEGMGMGLSICRTIVEAHGGRLWAEANKDRGATFRFTLRNATAAAPKAVFEV